MDDHLQVRFEEPRRDSPHLANRLHAAATTMATPVELPYRWVWKTKLADRRGQLFRVVCRGALNSCMIEFGDGWRCITSRNALRKARPETC